MALEFTVGKRFRRFAAAHSHKTLRGKYFVAPNYAEQFRHRFCVWLSSCDGVIDGAGGSIQIQRFVARRTYEATLDDVPGL